MIISNFSYYLSYLALKNRFNRMILSLSFTFMIHLKIAKNTFFKSKIQVRKRAVHLKSVDVYF